MEILNLIGAAYSGGLTKISLMEIQAQNANQCSMPNPQYERSFFQKRQAFFADFPALFFPYAPEAALCKAAAQPRTSSVFQSLPKLVHPRKDFVDTLRSTPPPLPFKSPLRSSQSESFHLPLSSHRVLFHHSPLKLLDLSHITFQDAV